MDNSNNILELGGFYFIHNFDSGNLGQVERVPKEQILSSLNHKSSMLETPDHEFNIWTRPDCAGTQFENGNRTWFYFGIQGGEPGALVRLNIINLNKQGKMYNQGMAPVTRTLPGKPLWERIRDRPIHSMEDNTFSLTFKYRTPDNLKATTFFAFTYPFSFSELQMSLNSIDLKFMPLAPQQSLDDIYYWRENLINSLEGRRTDLLTITSHHGITTEREERLKNLFPDKNVERPFKFLNKKVIFISARVHPGETPSSFVFNGFLNLILSRKDPVAIQLRKLYVFKLVPFLNPDGVARGHYRTDTRGVNLNRVYLNPSLEHHPTIYAARALIRYHHFGCERDEDGEDILNPRSMHSINEEQLVPPKKKPLPKSPVNTKRLETERCASPPVRAPQVISRSARVSSPEARSDRTYGDALAAQVCDLNIKETKPCIEKTSSTSTFVVENCPSLLDDLVIRDCLGSEVHLSRSDELTIQGPNPLRQLRDTLKNSISLLMGNSCVVDTGESISEKVISTADSTMKIGWCRECRVASNLDETLQHLECDDSNDNTSRYDTSVESTKDQYMICSNCFKKCPTVDIEEEIKVTDSASDASIPAGDSIECGINVEVKLTGGDSSEETLHNNGDSVESKAKPSKPKKKQKPLSLSRNTPKEPESGLYLYVDMHGHASKKGIFMYGNHFSEMERSVECMLLPRVMSLNNLHFHFSSCNFTERNMYLRDRRDGMSREGSGRVAVLKATGLVRSYTLECNYNTGRLVNVLPPTLREIPSTSAGPGASAVPPKYTPHIYEEVGRSLGASILDLTGQHPNSRIPGSEHRNLTSVREWLRAHMRNSRPPQLTMSRLRPKTSSPSRVPLYARSLTKTKMADVERKENTYIGAKPECETKKANVRAGRSSNEILINRFIKKTDKPFVSRSRSRHSSENEAKPKTLSSKRRSVLAIRKPNAGKARSISKSKTSVRRNIEEVDSIQALPSKSSKVTPGTFAIRSYRKDGVVTRAESTKPTKGACSSSSSEEALGGWEEVAGGTALGSDSGSLGKRRPYPPPPAPPAPHLKKIRLKTSTS